MLACWLHLPLKSWDGEHPSIQTEGTAAGAQRPLFRHSQLCFLMCADARRAPRLKTITHLRSDHSSDNCCRTIRQKAASLCKVKAKLFCCKIEALANKHGFSHYLYALLPLETYNNKKKGGKSMLTFRF